MSGAATFWTFILMGVVTWLVIMTITGLQEIDDLEQRITTLETVRIEYHAPTQDGG